MESGTFYDEIRYRGRRVYNLGANVEAWNKETGNAISHKDLCKVHAAVLDRDPHVYDRILLADCGDPQGIDGWGGEADHPNYDDDEYRCALPHCRVLLGGW
jgi:hypothetical protein